MNDTEKLQKAIDLLCEWRYELCHLDTVPKKQLQTSLDSLISDYRRLDHNTICFLEETCQLHWVKGEWVPK